MVRFIFMIIVTGAAGFIGSHVVDQLLERGFDVLGIDNFDSFYNKSIKLKNIEKALPNKRYLFLEGDIGDRFFLASLQIQPTLVIHLTAKAGVQPSLKNPASYIANNVQSTVVLMEWMKQVGCKKIVVASSSSVYGNTTTPFTESDTNLFPLSPYAQTKRSVELLSYTYHHLYGFDCINLRFFTVFGPRQRPDLAIHKFVKLIESNSPITLYGKGDTQRDYTYIDDIVNGVLSACTYVTTKTTVYQLINLGNSNPISLTGLIDSIEEVMGKKAQRTFISEQPGDMKVTYANTDKAFELLGYAPKTTLKEGLFHFYEWYKQTNVHEKAKHRYSYIQRGTKYS